MGMPVMLLVLILVLMLVLALAFFFSSRFSYLRWMDSKVLKILYFFRF